LIDRGTGFDLPSDPESFMPEPTLELLQSLMLQSLEGQREIRHELGGHRSLLLALAD